MFTVTGIETIRDTARAVLTASDSIKERIDTATVSTMSPEWTALVTRNAAAIKNPTVAALITPGAAIIGGLPPKAVAAASTQSIGRRGKLAPSWAWPMAEFGAKRAKVTTYWRKNRKTSGRHRVSRRAGTAWNRRTRRGYVAYPAFAQLAPRMTSLWAKIVLATYYEALGDD